MQTIELTPNHVIQIPEGAALNSPTPLINPSIQRSAFRNRFTFTERVELEVAAETDAAVRVFLKDIDLSDEVDLLSEDIQQAISMLVEKGLLSEARAAEILRVS